MLQNEAALKQRIYSVYRAMKKRAEPKYWKSGKRAGRVRIPGLEQLPFTKEQLWAHALNQVGESGIICPYCTEIGRRANVITLATLVFDHQIPLWNGGTWELSNLHACCADCNLLKGKLTYQTFIVVMQFIEGLAEPRDRSSLYSCLRSHGVSGRMRGFYKPKSAALPQPQTDVLRMENF